jgi:hypothetical protein
MFGCVNKNHVEDQVFPKAPEELQFEPASVRLS